MSEREDRELVLVTYHVWAFRVFYPKTFKLIIEIVNDFISEINKELHTNLKISRNNKLVIISICNQCALIIKDKVLQNNLLRSNLNKYEKSKVKLGADIKDLYKERLRGDLESFFHFAKTTLILSVGENIKKGFMQKLNIYRKYKPAGKKYEEGRKRIYSSIPFIQKSLIEEHGGIKKGKSDLITSVKNTIKVLEKEKCIPVHKYDPAKVYDSYLKSDYFSESKSKRRIHTLRFSDNIKKVKSS